MAAMVLDPAQLPVDIAALTALLIAANARAEKAEARTLALDAQIAHLKLTIAKMRRDTFGASSEKGARLLDQLEMQLGELVATVAAAKVADAIEQPTLATEEPLQKPARRSLDEKLPRERIVHAAPCACAHCGSDRLRKLGEIVTETLEHVPEQWKVLQHVREKFTCRACEKITETPAPSHPIARGRAGPQLLAEVLHNKYRAHLPLNRQKRSLRGPRHRSRCLDAGRLGGRVYRDTRSAGRGNRKARACGRTYPCRRHHGAGSGQGKMQHGPVVGLRAR